MTRIGKTLLAGTVVAGLGALVAAQPANAAIATYDLVFSTPVDTSATGSISIDTALLTGNSTCGFGQGCGFTGFAAEVKIGSSTFVFGPNTNFLFDVTVVGGIPVEVDLSTETMPSNEDPTDFASLSMAGDAYSVSGVIDGWEFNFRGTYAIATGGEDPDPVGVPEPATLMLFGAGLAGAALMRRKRASAA
jgi:hypothetical protein